MEVIKSIIHTTSYNALLQQKQINEDIIRDSIKELFPKIGLQDRINVANLLKDQQLFFKIQKLMEIHQEIASKIEWLGHQIISKSHQNGEQSIMGTGKKITRAALARRHQKNQQQIRKDQIFVRLTPKSQACIQFMLCNRNFPRMECKLSCNQHLEYLVNYLTDKWVRGKVGYKVVLYPDNSFLKSVPLSQKEKALKQPLNNYLMFTDIMTCCGIHQNGVLNLSYDIVQVHKGGTQKLNPVSAPKVDSNGFPQANINIKNNNAKDKFKLGANLPQLGSSFLQKPKFQQRNHNNMPSPNKGNLKEDYMRQTSMFNKNSNFFGNGEESLFGSLGFNFNFGKAAAKNQDNLLSINSINYYDAQYHETKRLKQQKPQKQIIINLKVEQPRSQFESQSLKNAIKKQQIQENAQERIKGEDISDNKLGTLISFLQQMEKQKESVHQGMIIQTQQAPNSNKIKDVKTVTIVKKRQTNT